MTTLCQHVPRRDQNQLDPPTRLGLSKLIFSAGLPNFNFQHVDLGITRPEAGERPRRDCVVLRLRSVPIWR